MQIAALLVRLVQVIMIGCGSIAIWPDDTILYTFGVAVCMKDDIPPRLQRLGIGHVLLRTSTILHPPQMVLAALLVRFIQFIVVGRPATAIGTSATILLAFWVRVFVIHDEPFVGVFRGGYV